MNDVSVSVRLTKWWVMADTTRSRQKPFLSSGKPATSFHLPMRMKISQFVVIAVSIFLLLVGGTAWVGAERLGAQHEITLAKLEKTDSTQWVAALDAVHRPLAESSVAALLTMTTTLGKALWVIKSLGACLTVSALCLLVLGLKARRQIGDAHLATRGQ